MRAKRLIPRIDAARLRSLRRTYRGRSERLHVEWLTRTQPAVIVATFAANHFVALGQARDEMERKA